LKKRKKKHDHSLQECWDTIKIPNLRVHGVEDGDEVQTNGTENLFNESIAENSQILGKIWAS
jgi:hypothetical protein